MPERDHQQETTRELAVAKWLFDRIQRERTPWPESWDGCNEAQQEGWLNMARELLASLPSGDGERGLVEFTPKEVQVLFAAMAGNHPESLAEHRMSAMRKLAKLKHACAPPSGETGGRRKIEAHLCLSCGAVYGRETECADHHEPATTMDVVEVGIRLKNAWEDQIEAGVSFLWFVQVGQELYRALAHYADEGSWINEREYRGFPGHHAKAVAVAAIKGTDPPAPPAGETGAPDEAPLIEINGMKHRAKAAVMTGAELRYLPTPPVGDDMDLFRVVPDGEDRYVATDEIAQLDEQSRFFTVPRFVNAGAGETGDGRELREWALAAPLGTNGWLMRVISGPHIRSGAVRVREIPSEGTER